MTDERLDTNRLARAQRGDEHAFAQLTAPYRDELQLHCYRILGSPAFTTTVCCRASGYPSGYEPSRLRVRPGRAGQGSRLAGRPPVRPGSRPRRSPGPAH